MVPGGKEGRGGIVREFRIDMYTLLYLKQINNKDLVLSITQGPLLNILQQTKWENNLKKNR